MVTLGTAGLVAAFVLVALLLLSLNLYTQWSWRIKATMIALVSVFYLVMYASLPPLMGWPTAADLPKRFNLVAVYVQEPDKATGSKGEIFLWATDLAHGPRGAEPRAYRVPFNGDLHARVVEAGNKMRKGLPQLGEVREEQVGPNARPTDESQGGRRVLQSNFSIFPTRCSLTSRAGRRRHRTTALAVVASCVLVCCPAASAATLTEHLDLGCTQPEPTRLQCDYRLLRPGALRSAIAGQTRVVIEGQLEPPTPAPAARRRLSCCWSIPAIPRGNRPSSASSRRSMRSWSRSARITGLASPRLTPTCSCSQIRARR